MHMFTKSSELYFYIRNFMIYYGSPLPGTSELRNAGYYQSPSLTHHLFLFQNSERRETRCFQNLSVWVACFYNPSFVCGLCLLFNALSKTTSAVSICSVPGMRNIPGFCPYPAPYDYIEGFPRFPLPSIESPLRHA